MAHHRDLCADDPPHQLRPLASAFDLDGLGPGLFHKPDSVGHALALIRLVAAKRHVRHHQRPPHRSPHAARVEQHLVHGDGQRVLVALHDHGQRVANKDDIQPSLIDQPRAGIVIRRHHG